MASRRRVVAKSGLTWLTRYAPLQMRVLVAAALLVLTFGSASAVVAFLQVPDDPTAKSGTAQVVAQGVVTLADGDLRWRVAEGTAPAPANASPAITGPGFVIAQSGVVLVENVETGEQQRLPAGEAMLTNAGVEQIRVALGSDIASYRALTIVDMAVAEGDTGTELFSSEPFTGPGARHDLDLLQDALGPGGSFAVPGGALPTLVFIIAGGADVTTESGDVISLGADEALSLPGPLVITAGENGADVAAVYTGPAVPRLAQAAATPASAVRVIATANDAAENASASPVPDAELAVEPDPDSSGDSDADDDGDALTAAQEAELNTDSALADTDEDGLTDGQEALQIGTAPLAADTDGDGVLDGDEVAQGTDPLDGAAGTFLEGGPAILETPAADPEPQEPAGTVGDSDGDGLEDTIELELGTDLADSDTDDDGALDGDEYFILQSGTRNPDTDGDGVLDGTEAANGTDPNDPNSF